MLRNQVLLLLLNYRLAGVAVTVEPAGHTEFVEQPWIDDDLYQVVNDHQSFEFEWRSIPHPFDAQSHQN